MILIVLKRKQENCATWAMVSTWMGDHSCVVVVAVVKNTVKSQEWRNRAPTINTPEKKN